MTTLTHTYRVMINAPPEAVFAYVSDLTRHPEWSGGRLKIEAAGQGICVPHLRPAVGRQAHDR